MYIMRRTIAITRNNFYKLSQDFVITAVSGVTATIHLTHTYNIWRKTVVQLTMIRVWEHISQRS